MKHLLLAACCLLTAAAHSETPTDEEYKAAREVVKAYVEAKRSTKATAKAATPTVDPTIKEIARVAKEQRNRFEVLRKTVNRYDPAKTNLFARPARASMQTKLTNAREAAAKLYVSFTNQLAQTSAYSNLYVIVSAQATAAQAKITDEIADLEAKIAKYQEYQTKYPLFKSLWAALINDAENRIKVLQALTGGN